MEKPFLVLLSIDKTKLDKGKQRKRVRSAVYMLHL